MTDLNKIEPAAPHPMVGAGSIDLLNSLSAGEPLLWLNPLLNTTKGVLCGLPFKYSDIVDAQLRLDRFAPLLQTLFPQLEESQGIIESNIVPVDRLKAFLEERQRHSIPGKLWVKADHDLPIAGSIKARGGIYEVLCIAEKLALENQLLSPSESYKVLGRAKARQFFSHYRISVGSTGNLGMSVGIIARALGFKCAVHMSAEAAQWKKDRLGESGVELLEYDDDYAVAVAKGRDAAAGDPSNYFVDDESSPHLFLGYSVAALRLKTQLEKVGVVVDEEHPLFVYLPCGVGGAPGGITFGLKHVFGDAVHCFFSEPTQAPSMLLGLVSGEADHDPSIYDIGLDNNTAADGLAVPRASLLVRQLIKALLSGCFTVVDTTLYKYLYYLSKLESMQIEPSAAAGFDGPRMLLGSDKGMEYINSHGLSPYLADSNHIIWTTGGSMLPTNEFQKFYNDGKSIVSKGDNFLVPEHD